MGRGEFMSRQPSWCAAYVFSFTHRSTGFPEKSFVRVDVTDEFPFLVTKMSPYYDR